MGFRPEQINQLLGAPAQRTLYIWDQHVPILRVYEDCQWELLPLQTKAGLVWLHRGIAGAEIDSVMNAHEIPQGDRNRVFRGVRTMAAAAAPVLNSHL